MEERGGDSGMRVGEVSQATEISGAVVFGRAPRLVDADDQCWGALFRLIGRTVVCWSQTGSVGESSMLFGATPIDSISLKDRGSARPLLLGPAKLISCRSGGYVVFRFYRQTRVALWSADRAMMFSLSLSLASVFPCLSRIFLHLIKHSKHV